MITKLERTVHRETRITYGGRSLIVSLEPPHILRFRLKGTQKTYMTTVNEVFDSLRKQDAERDVEDKKRKKKKLVYPPESFTGAPVPYPKDFGREKK